MGTEQQPSTAHVLQLVGEQLKPFEGREGRSDAQLPGDLTALLQRGQVMLDRLLVGQHPR